MAKKHVHVYPAGGESILHEMFNLICPAGHKAFSPEPMSLVGSECNSARDGNANTKCHKRLAFLADSRSIPTPKPKSKLRKMKRY